MALYDPTPKVVSPDFSLSEFLAWVRTKPAAEEYPYGDIFGCALCQFLTDRSIPFLSVGGTDWKGADGTFRRIPRGLDDALCAGEPTFGALAARLEAELAR
jgi:hypothetical protein